MSSLFKVGDEVKIRSARTSDTFIYEWATWQIHQVCERKDKWRKTYYVYVIEGVWKSPSMRGRRTTMRTRTHYLQYRASRLKRVKKESK